MQTLFYFPRNLAEIKLDIEAAQTQSMVHLYKSLGVY